MNTGVLVKLSEKLKEFDTHATEIEALAGVVDQNAEHTAAAISGIIAGRLYNTFYYQTRRILGRDPTPDEFKEFLKFVDKSITHV